MCPGECFGVNGALCIVSAAKFLLPESVGISCIHVRPPPRAVSFPGSAVLLLFVLLKCSLEGILNGLGLFCFFVFELNQELQNMCWVFALWFGRE